MQPPADRVAVPVRGQDAERQAQIVDVTPSDRVTVVGGVEEIGDPCGRVAAGDRGPGHPRELQRACGGSGRSAFVELIGERLEILLGEVSGWLLAHADSLPVHAYRRGADRMTSGKLRHHATLRDYREDTEATH